MSTINRNNLNELKDEEIGDVKMNNDKKYHPFFSIIIPVYNCEEYLDECLLSIFNQTIRDFELILIDDEANKATVSILNKWGKKYPEIVHIMHQKNSGVFISKQNGLKSAKGQYCYVMDDDDFLIPNNALESIKEIINKTQSDIVVFNATNDIENKKFLYNIPFEDGQVFEKDTLSIIYDSFLDSQNLNHIWLMVFKKSLFEANNEYKKLFRMSRDGGYLVSQIITNANKIVYIKKAIYYWRTQNPDSLSKHYDVMDFFNSVVALHERILECSQKWKYKSQETEHLIHKNYMTDICTATMRVSRMIETASLTKIECLQRISNDAMFRREYSLSGLKLYRKAVVWALYHRQFWIIHILFAIANIMKKIR